MFRLKCKIKILLLIALDQQDSNLPVFNFPECLRFFPFSKNGLTTRFLRFKSPHPVPFCCSLQRKETQKVHHVRFESPCLYLLGVLCFRKEILKVRHHFCPENEKNGLRNNVDAALKPVFWLENLEKPRKIAKNAKRAQKSPKSLGRLFGFLSWSE